MNCKKPIINQKVQQLFDSHCHLIFSAFDHDRHRVLQNCIQLGIHDICIPSTCLNEWESIFQLASTYKLPKLYIALGLHPYFVANHDFSHLEALDKQLALNNPNLIAVGEIGLDFANPTAQANKEQQETLFNEQLNLARFYKQPVIIHARKSHDMILKRLRTLKLDKGGIIHAFSGSEQQAQQYIDLGFKLGFGGGVTYERAKKTRKLAASLPLSSVVLETDAPDMPLFGHQGKRNSPEKLPIILETIAQLRPEPIEEIALQTTKNAKTIFGIQC